MSFYFDLDFALTGAFYFDDTGMAIPLIRWVGIGTHPALIFGGSDSEKLDYD